MIEAATWVYGLQYFSSSDSLKDFKVTSDCKFIAILDLDAFVVLELMSFYLRASTIKASVTRALVKQAKSTTSLPSKVSNFKSILSRIYIITNFLTMYDPPFASFLCL
jgi:hypothetical protein